MVYKKHRACNKERAMKLIFYIVLCLQCIDILAVSSVLPKSKGRHSRILRKKQKKLELRDSGQEWPDRYGYDPKIPLS